MKTAFRLDASGKRACDQPGCWQRWPCGLHGARRAVVTPLDHVPMMWRTGWTREAEIEHGWEQGRFGEHGEPSKCVGCGYHVCACSTCRCEWSGGDRVNTSEQCQVHAPTCPTRQPQPAPSGCSTKPNPDGSVIVTGADGIRRWYASAEYVPANAKLIEPASVNVTLPRFAIGDRVECVDVYGAREKLREGAIYNVDRLYVDGRCVGLAEFPGSSFDAVRFRPAPEQPKVREGWRNLFPGDDDSVETWRREGGRVEVWDAGTGWRVSYWGCTDWSTIYGCRDEAMDAAERRA